MTKEYVTLADSCGNPAGRLEKLAAHQNGGALHLGFSILVFNAAGQLLLQKRAAEKYHFAGLWSNSCCGHPRPGERVADAAERRLAEEFGFTTTLQLIKTLNYQADDPRSGLTEREHLSIFVGGYNQEPRPNPVEIGDWRWEGLGDLERQARQNPSQYTPWFLILIREIDLRAAADAACSGQTGR
ncbi:MAG: isopentenyl-diphosphate Delta-isomerase [Gammaproteobacteria bacterium]|nr:isopentenyl-diphosphate Delta-isomerase [Gammaproteobacteria bacterium]